MRIRLAVTLLLLVGVLAAVALGTSSPATAKGKPCWERVLDDWLDNNNIDGTYSVACLRQALDNAGEDLLDYSNFPDQIDAAIQAALRPKHPGSAAGGTSTNDSSGGTENGDNTPRKLQNVPDRSYYRRAIDNLGTTSADSLPIPLLVLAGLGTALLLTAAGLAARKRIKARPRPPAS
jgi:hypothetical protein